MSGEPEKSAVLDLSDYRAEYSAIGGQILRFGLLRLILIAVVVLAFSGAVSSLDTGELAGLKQQLKKQAAAFDMIDLDPLLDPLRLRPCEDIERDVVDDVESAAYSSVEAAPDAQAREVERSAGRQRVDRARADLVPILCKVHERYTAAFTLAVSAIGSEIRLDLRSWMLWIVLLLVASEAYRRLLRTKQLVVCGVARDLLHAARGQRAATLDTLYFDGPPHDLSAFLTHPYRTVRGAETLAALVLLMMFVLTIARFGSSGMAFVYGISVTLTAYYGFAYSESIRGELWKSSGVEPPPLGWHQRALRGLTARLIHLPRIWTASWMRAAAALLILASLVTPTAAYGCGAKAATGLQLIGGTLPRDEEDGRQSATVEAQTQTGLEVVHSRPKVLWPTAWLHRESKGFELVRYLDLGLYIAALGLSLLTLLLLALRASRSMRAIANRLPEWVRRWLDALAVLCCLGLTLDAALSFLTQVEYGGYLHGGVVLVTLPFAGALFRSLDREGAERLSVRCVAVVAPLVLAGLYLLVTAAFVGLYGFICVHLGQGLLAYSAVTLRCRAAGAFEASSAADRSGSAARTRTAA